jgi:hypothetical protein
MIVLRVGVAALRAGGAGDHERSDLKNPNSNRAREFNTWSACTSGSDGGRRRRSGACWRYRWLRGRRGSRWRCNGGTSDRRQLRSRSASHRLGQRRQHLILRHAARSGRRWRLWLLLRCCCCRNWLRRWRCRLRRWSSRRVSSSRWRRFRALKLSDLLRWWWILRAPHNTNDRSVIGVHRDVHQISITEAQAITYANNSIQNKTQNSNKLPHRVLCFVYTIDQCEKQ